MCHAPFPAVSNSPQFSDNLGILFLGKFCFKSHHGRYLSSNAHGILTATKIDKNASTLFDVFDLEVILYTKALFIGAIAFVVIILIPIPLSATLIAPIALAVHQGVSMLIMMKYIRKSIYINLLFRTLLPLSIAIVFALFIYIWQHLYPVIVSATVVLLALPAIAIASGINRNDINTLKVLLK